MAHKGTPSRHKRDRTAQKEIVGVVKEVGAEMLRLQTDMADDARWRQQQQLLLPVSNSSSPTLPRAGLDESDSSSYNRGSSTGISTSLLNIVSQVRQGVNTTLRVSKYNRFPKICSPAFSFRLHRNPPPPSPHFPVPLLPTQTHAPQLRHLVINLFYFVTAGRLAAPAGHWTRSGRPAATEEPPAA